MKDRAHFYDEVKTKVKEYFASAGISDKGNRKLYRKAIILVSAWAALYIGILLSGFSLWLTIPLYVLLGIVGALIGFNVMHDGAHGSYSHKKRLNNLMGYSMNMLGTDLFLWKVQHNVLHHTYTNIEGYDNDIDSWPTFRFHPGQIRKKFHKYQHIYFLPLYGLSSLVWIFFSDFKRYFTRTIGVFQFRKMSLKEHVIFWATKIFLFSFYYIIPAIILGPWTALIGLFAMFFCMGIFLTIVFQLAHVVERTDKVEHIDHKVDEHWAIHEIETSANFAPKNKVWTWFLGGLNYQIEHHLFPHISHIHYPQIAAIVERVCQEYGVSYVKYATFRAALASHVSYLKYMGANN